MDDGTSRPRREDLCRNFFCSVFQNGIDTTRYLMFPLRCKSWDCPECRKDKAQSYRERMQKLYDGRGLWFYTLTYYHSVSPAEAWATYNAAWNRLRTNLSKQCGHFNYVRILESHNASPYPHLHIIADVKIKPTMLNKAALAAGFGYQMDCKPVTSQGAMAYIVKYLTKEWTNAEGWSLRKKYRCRVISCSRGLLSPERRSEGWKSLLTGSDFGSCLDHIRLDYQWRTDARATVTHELIEPDFAEITVVWTDVDPTLLTRPPDDWQPDDWVPK